MKPPPPVRRSRYYPFRAQAVEAYERPMADTAPLLLPRLHRVVWLAALLLLILAALLW